MNLNNTSYGVPPKILIIRLSSIGDIILSTPFIRQVRNRFPNAQIDFVIKDIFKDLLKFNPHINNLYNLQIHKNKSELSALRKKFEKESYDVVSAVMREKEIKQWHQQKKNDLVLSKNREWKDLSDQWQVR